MENEKEGFPITSLREINTLLKAQHPNIVTVRVSASINKTEIRVSCLDHLRALAPRPFELNIVEEGQYDELC